MRFLLDTHTILWWLANSERLSKNALNLISDHRSTIYISAVSGYEIHYKHHRGKLSLPDELAGGFSRCMVDEGWNILPMSLTHAMCAARLESEHRDPFDRLLAGQAISESLSLITSDAAMQTFQDLTTSW